MRAMKNSAIIHCQNLWAAYRVEPVLQNIDWTWQVDQQWAIVGGNGAGKSALAEIITDQLRPQRGSIVRAADLDSSSDIIHLSFKLQRELIAHDIRFDDSEVRADANDIGTTVRQIVLRKQATDDRFEYIAKQCHIDHILDRGIRFVSTGESRKTLLARALFQQPRVLILDNPFEGLDKNAQTELLALINDLLESDVKLLLLLKQYSEIPANVSHIMVLKEGKITTQGTRDQVLASIEQVTPHQHRAIADLPPPVTRPYDLDRSQPLIRLQDVKVSYGDQIILNHINWRLDWGQHCCISGPNGAGKSTLLSLLCGDNHKAYGQNITLFGKRRGDGESVWELKQKFGIVSTQLQLNHIGRTRVAEVIASGLYDSVGLYKQCSGSDRKIALQWLQLMDLEHIATQFFNQLSFGQQRLAMLARAMVKSPPILILDEPCIGLDLEHRQLVLALVDKIAARGDCHILYVSHTYDEMPACINQQLMLSEDAEGGYTCTTRAQ